MIEHLARAKSKTSDLENTVDHHIYLFRSCAPPDAAAPSRRSLRGTSISEHFVLPVPTLPHSPEECRPARPPA